MVQSKSVTTPALAVLVAERAANNPWSITNRRNEGKERTSQPKLKILFVGAGTLEPSQPVSAAPSPAIPRSRLVWARCFHYRDPLKQEGASSREVGDLLDAGHRIYAGISYLR